MLWVQVGEISVLLGSDLEESSQPTGWSAILKSSGRPQGKAALFKVPHHGSSNADCPEVWVEMLEPDPHAVLTPFSRGNVYLPRLEDMQRILTRTMSAFMTGRPKVTRVKHEKTVEKTIRETVKNIRRAEPQLGHIRIRTKAQAPPFSWKVDLFGEAAKLQEFAVT